jgi:outer membrane cobalamin receptor
MHKRLSQLSLLCAGAVLLPSLALANDVLVSAATENESADTTPTRPIDTDAEVITVWGKRARQIGTAQSASEGQVDFSKFVDRPLLRVGELAEVVPGLAATQHSGTGKANQYFLRGFNLDHGTDFSISLDDIPLNLRTNAHGQGYLDINFLIPEIIGKIDYRKGVASGDVGDFSAAGSASFSSFDLLPHSFVQVEVGENAWQRAVIGTSFGEAGYMAWDFTQDDGPWTQPENLEKINGFIRLNHDDWSLKAGTYQAEWDATDQVPSRAIAAGLIDRLGNIDRNVGGKARRSFANLSYKAESLSANVYVMRYALNLFSNFTYLLNDPANGDQFEQAERRTIVGGSVRQKLNPIGVWTPTIGLETRFDAIDPIGLYQTIKPSRLQTVREDSVNQSSLGAYAMLDGALGPARVNLALRADAMAVDVTSSDSRNSGKAVDVILSPKASLAWRFAPSLEGYVSAGQGFHSNDARGATIAFDPVTGDGISPVPIFVRATGFEAGLRYERPKFSATASIFALDLDSELVYVGDAGTTEPSDASRRSGIEVTFTRVIGTRLTLDGAAAFTHARFKEVDPGQNRIPLAPEYMLSGGATVQLGSLWTGSLTVRHLGAAPLIEDNSQRSEASTVANGRVAFRQGRYTIALEALNMFDSQDADITYFYASRLSGEPADGVEDTHFHPIPPRSLRLQLRLEF